MIIIHMNLELKALSCLNGKCFDFKNKKRFYGILIAIDRFLRDCE